MQIQTESPTRNIPGLLLLGNGLPLPCISYPPSPFDIS